MSVEKESCTVLFVSQFKYPEVIEVDNSLETFQQMLGEDVAVYEPYDDPVAILLDPNGKSGKKDYNRTVFDKDGKVADIIAGDFLVIGYQDEKICSLTKDQIALYEEKFHTPEAFVKMGRGIISVKMDEDMVKNANAPSLHIHKKKDQVL